MRRSMFTVALVGLLATAAAPLLAGDVAETGVKVETSRALYVPGDKVEITVTNTRRAPVFLAGCNSFQLERFEAETYAPVRGARCVGEGDAVKVPPGTHSLVWEPGSEHSGQVLRLAVAFGWGCDDGRALSQSRCQEFATSYSASFRVGRRSEAAPSP